LVVDADMRRPTIHTIFDQPNNAGLADYLVSAKTLDEVIQLTAIPNVSVISAGSGGNAKGALPLLISPRMLELIRTVGERYDMVLYDTPPILGVSDAVSLARDVGASILVIQHRRYPRHMSRRARQVAEGSGTKILGVVVNNVHLSEADTYFYYHNQYDDYLKGPDLRGQERVFAAAHEPRKGKGKSDEIQLSDKY
jgi:capsular exopolysaccharide synthesis family protein